jgi:hypothetical protein
MDVTSIDAGTDFVEQIYNALESCDIVLALIDRDWVAVTNERNREGANANDYVRIEIEAALERELVVIPVLLDGAAMPSENEVPPSLAELVKRNAIEVTHSGFNDDMRALFRVLRRAIKALSKAGKESEQRILYEIEHEDPAVLELYRKLSRLPSYKSMSNDDWEALPFTHREAFERVLKGKLKVEPATALTVLEAMRWTLDPYRNPEYCQAILNLADADDEEVRAKVADALGGLVAVAKTGQTEVALCRLLLDPSVKVSQTAAFEMHYRSWSKVPDHVFSQVIEAVNVAHERGDPETRRGLLSFYGEVFRDPRLDDGQLDSYFERILSYLPLYSHWPGSGSVGSQGVWSLRDVFGALKPPQQERAVVTINKLFASKVPEEVACALECYGALCWYKPPLSSGKHTNLTAEYRREFIKNVISSLEHKNADIREAAWLALDRMVTGLASEELERVVSATNALFESSQTETLTSLLKFYGDIMPSDSFWAPKEAKLSTEQKGSILETVLSSLQHDERKVVSAGWTTLEKIAPNLPISFHTSVLTVVIDLWEVDRTIPGKQLYNITKNLRGKLPQQMRDELQRWAQQDAEDKHDFDE